ncbi:MAG: alanine racemase [Chromatiaceae bacterium]|nr:alanine racemase [Chromatiaceae bacterium]
MSRPARCRIDLAALRHNLRLARRLAPGARLAAVVKANAYGHGAVRVARALAGEADAFAVACMEEALELRESGIERPIVLLEGVFSPDELALAEHAALTPVVHSRAQLEWFLAARPRRPLDCWLKLDSGMHRLGLTPREFIEAEARLRDCAHLGQLVAMSHLARADEPGEGEGEGATRRQIADFRAALAGCDLPASLPASLANSAAILAWPEAHADWVRPGLMLYGASPFAEPHPQAAKLRPVMTLESTLVAVRELAPGERVGYGGRFCCARPTRLGVVAIGYADGYPRHAPDGAPLLVEGRLAPLAGRVSMDMLTVDLTDLPEAGPGARVELWGAGLDVGRVAAASGTIAYQLYCAVSRVAVEVRDDSDDQ